jgi:hypothetical protein
VVAVPLPVRHRRTASGTAAATTSLASNIRHKATALLRHEARRLLLPLAVLTAVSSLGTAAAPGLLSSGRPLLLVALSPRLSFLALAAPKVGLLPFLLVAGVRLCLADPFHFFLGRRHGTSAVDKIANRHRWLKAATKAATHSVPLLVFLRPNGTNLAIAGASRHRALHIAAADVVGTLAYLLLIHQVGASVLPA